MPATTFRKPRHDARLKHLPPTQQEELYEFLKNNAYTKAVAWLAERGIATHATSVREFWHWYPLTRELQDLSTVGETLREALQQHPELKREGQELSEASLALFELRALQKGDTDRFVKLRRLRLQETRVAQQQQRLAQQEEKVALDRHRVQRQSAELFIHWHKQEKTRIVMERQVSYADRIELLGRALFKDWAEEDPIPGVIPMKGPRDCRAE